MSSAIVNSRIYVQTDDGGQTFGEFVKWGSSTYANNWSLPEGAIGEVLDSRSCCQGQVQGTVVAYDASGTAVGQESFAVDLTFCEAFCCREVSRNTFSQLETNIKLAAAG